MTTDLDTLDKEFKTKSNLVIQECIDAYINIKKHLKKQWQYKNQVYRKVLATFHLLK